MADGILDVNLAVSHVVQQFNCLGYKGAGLAAAVAFTLPYGCSYKERRRDQFQPSIARPKDRATPGTIDVRTPPEGDERPTVINCFSQWEPGKPEAYNRAKEPSGKKDSKEQREECFAACLKEIGKIQPLPESIAFPKDIGCAIAGGRWEKYESMIYEFARSNPACKVVIIDWTKSPGKQSSATANEIHARYIMGCPSTIDEESEPPSEAENTNFPIVRTNSGTGVPMPVAHEEEEAKAEVVNAENDLESCGKC